MLDTGYWMSIPDSGEITRKMPPDCLLHKLAEPEQNFGNSVTVTKPVSNIGNVYSSIYVLRPTIRVSLPNTAKPFLFHFAFNLTIKFLLITEDCGLKINP